MNSPRVRVGLRTACQGQVRARSSTNGSVRALISHALEVSLSVVGFRVTEQKRRRQRQRLPRRRSLSLNPMWREISRRVCLAKRQVCVWVYGFVGFGCRWVGGRARVCAYVCVLVCLCMLVYVRAFDVYARGVAASDIIYAAQWQRSDSCPEERPLYSTSRIDTRIFPQPSHAARKTPRLRCVRVRLSIC